ncbi:MAG: serine/threonine-protein kinase PknK [Chloroflexota bacterium]
MLAPNVATNLIGRRYALEAVIGQGGMGSVYRALDRLTGNRVALKRVQRDAAGGSGSTTYAGDFRLSLAREFKVLATMHHPHVIEVLDYGFDTQQQPYFTMELLAEPATIDDACAGLPLEEQIMLLVQMLQALAYLHRRGVLHRDLKPANVLVSGGSVKVLDFGLSVLAEHHAADDQHGTTAGTIAYMAPETLVGMSTTAASDLYAVGIMMYEIFAGQHPFQTDAISALINDVMYAMPDMNALDLSPDLALVIERLVQKDPTARYDSATEVIAALQEAMGHPLPVETVATRESFLKSARLVGRDEELGQLRIALADAIIGRGSVWMVAGESGVGKSRLMDELRTLAMVDGALVMRGHASNEGRTPYQLWHMVLRWVALLSDLDAVDAGLIKRLVPDIVTLPEYDLNAAAELESHRIQTRLIALLEQTLRAQSQPVVILLEDIHWASSESLTIVSNLVQIVRDLPVLCVISYRDDERPDLPKMLPMMPVLKLRRLANEQIAELSQAMLGTAGRQPQVVELLQRETEGNVFFLIEVVRALAEEVGELGQVGLTTLPQQVFSGGIELIIQRRLNHIPVEMQYLLQVAAVIGREQDLTLLRHISGGDREVDDFLIECANAAVLELEDGVWRFTHDRVRDGVLGRLSPPERSDIHSEVARGIEALYDPVTRAAILAHHWGAAGDRPREAHFCTIAGEQSLNSGAYQQAIDLFERALQLVDPSTMQPRESQQRRIYLQHRKAEAYLGFGGYTQARQIYQESLMLAEQLNDLEGLAMSLKGLGDVEFARAIYEQAEIHYLRSLETYRSLKNKAAEAQLLNNLGNVAYEIGDVERAHGLFQVSLNLSRELGNQWGMAGSLTTTDELQPVATSEAYRERRAQLIDTLTNAAQDSASTAAAFFELGQIAFQLSEWPEAEQNFQRALELAASRGGSAQQVAACDRLMQVMLVRDDIDGALAHAKQGLRMALMGDDPTLPLHALLSFARWYIYQGMQDSALELLAFILNAGDLPIELEDEAERLSFDIQDEMPEAAAGRHWEVGKARRLNDIAADLLDD